MEMTRRAMAPPTEEGQQGKKAIESDPPVTDQEQEQELDQELEEADGFDRVLTAGLRKLYDPILEEQVPAEMLEILRRGRK